MDPAAHPSVRPTLTPPQPPAEAAPGRRSLAAVVRRLDAATVALALVVGAGCAVRVGLWWQDRAFWRDELALVQSLDAYSPVQLLGPLSDAQSAPPLWLLLVRAVSLVAGDGERAYRLVAVSCGCATLVVMALLARRLVRHTWAAVVPLVLVMTISELVYYTAQTKQYATDTLLVTWLVLLGVRLLQRERSATGADRRTDLAWYGSLVLLPWFSHGAMIAAPFLAGWVALVQLRRGSRTVGRLAAGLALPALSVLAAAAHARQLTSRVSDFAAYWAPFLGPHGKGFAAWWDWHGFVLREFALRELGLPYLWGSVLVAAGLVIVVRRSPATGILLVLPLVAAYSVGVLGIYPFGRRLVLFCVPSLLVGAGVLVDAAARWTPKWTPKWTPRWTQRWAARRRRAWPDRADAGSPGGRERAAAVGVLASVLVLVGCWTGPSRFANDLTYLYGVDDYRQALAFVARKWQDGDRLVVGNGDRAAVRVYAPRLHLPEGELYRAMPRQETVRRTRCPLPSALSSARRVWLVTGDVVPMYADATSRYAVAAPMLSRFHSVWHHDKGLVTVQAVMPGSTPNAPASRCLDYAPVGRAGAPQVPPGLPAS